MQIVEFPLTKLKVKTDIDINLNFLGEVDSIYSTMNKSYKKLGMNSFELIVDYLQFGIGTIVRPDGMLLGKKENNSLEMYYFVKKQNTIQDYLFLAGHEEGHAIDHINCRNDFENLLSDIALIDTKSIKDREVFANIVGMYVLAMNEISMTSVSMKYINRTCVKESIALFEESKVKKLIDNYNSTRKEI